MIFIQYKELLSLLKSILLHNGFDEVNANDCAEIFTENTFVGVSSHGVNRFPHFIELVKSGHIKPNVNPTLENSFNAIEQWNGNLGPGPLNAKFITNKVIDLSNKFGIGCIALKDTNHWMRPGYYAWDAADKGYIFICWTNTIPIMPPWGAKTPTTGNNPIVLGVPRKEGNIVIDLALSQYSYGQLANYARRNEELPYYGGYNKNGELTKNAKEIYKAERPIPIGYWKGSGLSLLLDLIATILSDGKSTFELSKSKIDSGMSQVYIAIDPGKFFAHELIENSVNEILEYYLSAEKVSDEKISYPGERILKTKKENLKNGIPVDEKIWDKVSALMREV